MNKKHNSNMQMPGIASITNIGSNFKGAFMTGFTGSSKYTKDGTEHSYFAPNSGGFRGTIFNTKVDEETGKTYWDPQNSVGGILSAGYGVVGGGIAGAASGAVLSNFLEGGNIVRGAATGAVVGGAALVAAPFAIGAAARGTIGVLKNSDKILAGLGTGYANAAKTLGSVVRGGATAAMGAMTKGGVAGVLNPVSRHIGAFTGIAGALVKRKDGANADGIISDYSLSWLGKGVVAGGVIIKGAKDALNTYMNDKRGQIDPYISSTTPQIRLMDDAGASGDLVFALNNNRKG